MGFSLFHPFCIVPIEQMASCPDTGIVEMMQSNATGVGGEGKADTDQATTTTSSGLEDGCGNVLPNQIRDYLYLGSQDHFYNTAGVLRHLGITHVLSCVGGPMYDPEQLGGVVHHRVPMSDTGTSNLEDIIFPEAFEYLQSAILSHGGDEEAKGAGADGSSFLSSPDLSPVKGEGEDVAACRQAEATDRPPRILVHCHAGINRSATVVVGWLMHSERLTLKEAHADVLSKRGICLHDYYVDQLRNYDATFHGGRHSTQAGELPCTSSMMRAAVAMIAKKEEIEESSETE